MEDKMNNFIKKVDESLCLIAIQTNSCNYPRPQSCLPRHQQNRYRGNQFRSKYQRGRGYYQNRAYSPYQNQSCRPRYGQRFHAPQNNDASLAQGHYQAQNFHQSHGQTENPEKLNASGGSQNMHYTKIICHRCGGPDHMARDCVAQTRNLVLNSRYQENKKSKSSAPEK